MMGFDSNIKHFPVVHSVSIDHSTRTTNNSIKHRLLESSGVGMGMSGNDNVNIIPLKNWNPLVPDKLFTIVAFLGRPQLSEWRQMAHNNPAELQILSKHTVKDKNSEINTPEQGISALCPIQFIDEPNFLLWCG